MLLGLVCFLLVLTVSCAEADPCDPNPCQNGGTCNTGGSTGFTCTCSTGYAGAVCDIDTFCGPGYSPCQNNGTCDHASFGPVCDCTVDFAGVYCDIPRCSNVFTDATGVISSPLYDQTQYPASGADCLYTIIAPADQVIKVQFDRFDLPPAVDGECTDYVEVFDSASISDPDALIDRYCGNHTGMNYVSTSNASSFHFKAGGAAVDSGSYRGFSLRYSFGMDQCIGIACPENMICVNNFDDGYGCVCLPGLTGPSCSEIIDECASNPCENDGRCVSSFRNYTCVCKPGYTCRHCQSIIDNCASMPCLNGGECANMVNDYTCACKQYFEGRNCEIVNCSNLVISDSSGAIASPGYPDVYPPNATCSWIIVSQNPEERIYLTLTLIMVEGPYEQCEYDYLAIYDGNNATGVPRAKLCGIDLAKQRYQLPPSSDNAVTVTFHSDADVESNGFQLRYLSAIPGFCNSTLREDHNHLSVPSRIDPVPFGSITCRWTIVIEPASRVLLSVDKLNFSSDCRSNYLDVHDGAFPTPWSLRGRFCGLLNETGFSLLEAVSTTNAMVLAFHSDDPEAVLNLSYVSVTAAHCRNDCGSNSYCVEDSCHCYDGFVRHGRDGPCQPVTCDFVSCAKGGTCVESLEYGAYCLCPEAAHGRYCNGVVNNQ